MNKTIAALTVLGLTAAACGGGDEKVSTDSAPDSVPTSEVPVDTEAPVVTEAPRATTTTTTTIVPEGDPIRQPLTGEVVASEDDLVTLPALAIKIDNNDDRARSNQSGLAVADIVFEEIVEFGTRFAAVFHTEGSDPVGPIRSGREQDVALLSSLNEPLLAWSGGNPGVTRLIASSFLTDLNAQRNSGSYFRGPGSAPHDLYSSTDTLYDLTPDLHPGPPIQQFEYITPGEQFEGDEISSVELSMDITDIRWEWDGANGAFARFQEGTRHVDVTHGDIFATNVVVMIVDIRPSTIDANAPDAQTLGSGPVIVFSNGQAIAGRWERELAVGNIRFVDADGEQIELTPGNTWIELTRNTGGGAFTTQPGSEVDPATIPRIDLGSPELIPTAISIS